MTKETPFVPMTCAEFRTLLETEPGLIEARSGDAATRTRIDAHLLDCADCSALVADLRTIVRDAGDLPTLSPSRDLWAGIESRIEAPVVSLNRSGEQPAAVQPVSSPHEASPTMVPPQPTRLRTPHAARHAFRRTAIAASLLVAVTAGVTYTIATRRPTVDVAQSLTPRLTPSVIPASSRLTAEQTYDKEIATLHSIVSLRRRDLDSVTVATLEKNLKLIDRAIAESKAALARDPASAFLMDRLNHVYDSKLQLLRGVVTMPAGTE